MGAVVEIIAAIMPLLLMGGVGVAFVSSASNWFNNLKNRQQTNFILNNFSDPDVKLASLIQFYIAKCKKRELIDLISQIDSQRFQRIAGYYAQMFMRDYKADCGLFDDKKMPAGGNLILHLQIFLGDDFQKIAQNVY